MTGGRRILRVAGSCLVLGAAMSGSSWAQQAANLEATNGDPLRASVDIGIGWTDNIAEVAKDGDAESIATSGLKLQGEINRRRVAGVINADLRYFKYLDNTYSDELAGRLDGTLNLTVIEDRLKWVVEDHYGQSLLNPLRVPTPANRESINYLTTGPDVLFAFGTSGFSRLFGRYSLISYETSPLDNHREQMGLQVGMRPSRNGSVSLTVVGERVSYDTAVSTANYDRGQLFASYEVRAARTHLQADVGYTRIRNVAYTNGGMSGQLGITRRISPYSTLTLEVRRSVTDTSDRFRIPGAGATIETRAESGTPSADIFINRFGRAAWDFSRGSSGVLFSVSYLNDNYDGASLQDRHRTTAELILRRQMTPALSLRVVTSYAAEHIRRADFRIANSNFGEWRSGLGLRLGSGRKGYLDLSADHVDRNVDDNSRSFVENRLFLTLGYEFN